ncbi:MAG: hypothetical protein BIFFINMI_02313 [Phycisphaerae bacterium]|nr:hypothetical protein [Phycisphaerae bacterium]
MKKLVPCLMAALLLPAAPCTAEEGTPTLTTFKAPAVAAADKATELAAAEVGKDATPGQPRLFEEAEGLAVDRSDPADPRVVAYVGPCWIVPVQAQSEPGKPAPKAVIIDQGTGRVIARAHDVVKMPSPRVYYVDEFQLAAGSLKPGDLVGGANIYSGAGGMAVTLDLGKSQKAVMTIVASNMGPNFARGANGSKIRFGDGAGTLVEYAYGQGKRLIAFNAEKTLMAQCNSQVAATTMVDRFKDVLAGLRDRPEETRIWPADARPWLTGVDGWSPPPYGGSEIGQWHPTVKSAVQGQFMNTQVNSQVFVAAKVMHPYELPAAALGDGLDDGKVLSTWPVRLGEWVGVEKMIEFQTTPSAYPGMIINRAQAGKTVATEARVLDLRQDVRRLMIRCQAPKSEFAAREKDFAEVLSHMNLPAAPMDPIVVPLDPVKYRSTRKH